MLAEGGNGEPDAVIIATGSEVEVALDAREQLAGEGIAARVVSMPSRELFEKRDSAYADSVLPPGLPTVSVEAGVALGWSRFADASVSLERFGASAPAAEVFTQLGITADAVSAAVRDLL